jgi:hypothetical protein
MNNMSLEQLIAALSVTDVPSKITHDDVFGLAFSGAIRVGVHKNLPVTSGSWGKHDIFIPLAQEPFDGPQARRVPAFNKNMEPPHYVNHIYTAAISINPDMLKNAHTRTLFEQEAFAMPKAALRAAYEGTILAARELLLPGGISKERPLENVSDFLQAKKKQSRLFLTLVGGGESTANDPEWIVTILEQLQALIYASGLQICLVLWDDAKMAPLLERLEAISRRIQGGNIVELSQAAEKAGELLWLFDNGGKLTPRVDKDTALITLPIKKNNKPVTLPIWREAA